MPVRCRCRRRRRQGAVARGPRHGGVVDVAPVAIPRPVERGPPFRVGVSELALCSCGVARRGSA